MHSKKHMILAQIKNFIHPLTLLCLCIGYYVFFTVSALFDANHVLYNLEPYPDGLFYTLAGKDIISGKGFTVTYQDVSLPLSVPPLYPLFLTFFYLITQNTASFYLANILLGISCIYLLFYVIKLLTHNSWLATGGAALYCLHAHIVWLPSLPMSENIALFFFLLVLASLWETKSQKKLTLAGIGLVGLTFTRYSAIPISLTFAGILLFDVFRNHSSNIKLSRNMLFQLISIAIIIFSFAYIFLFQQLKDIQLYIGTTNNFYNISFIVNNIWQYGTGLLGLPIPFLWQNVPLLSTVISIICICFIFAILSSNKTLMKRKIIYLIITLVAQIPLLLIFYTVDSRYYIYSIPLLLCIFFLGIDFYWKSHQKIMIILIVTAATSLFFSQRNLYKQLISNNILGRSTAIQYESIQHFDTFFSQQPTSDTSFITALPPYLVAEYSNKIPSMLPLSSHQEFANKNQPIWGKTIDYKNLISEYQERLNKNEVVYISNAYVTHQQEVINDFESIKQKFNLELVSTGCLEACNIYVLTTKQ